MKLKAMLAGLMATVTTGQYIDTNASRWEVTPAGTFKVLDFGERTNAIYDIGRIGTLPPEPRNIYLLDTASIRLTTNEIVIVLKTNRIRRVTVRHEGSKDSLISFAPDSPQ